MATLRLSSLPFYQPAIVISISGSAALQQQLAEQGLFPGEEVLRVGTAPLGDPQEIRVGSTNLSIRTDDAACILVETKPIQPA